MLLNPLRLRHGTDAPPNDRLIVRPSVKHIPKCLTVQAIGTSREFAVANRTPYRFNKFAIVF